MVAIRKEEPTPFHYDHVPAELKQQKQWARYEKIDGRDKRPVKLNGRVMRWKKEPESKLTFEQVAPFEKIGYFITPESGMIGVDFDGCVDENGNIHPLVQHYIKNTYAEYSLNRGIKAHFKAQIPDNKKITSTDVPWGNPGDEHTQIEISAKDRFFTITGNKVPGCPSEINEAPEAIADMIARFAPKPKEKKKVEPKDNTRIDIVNLDPTASNWDFDSWVHKHLDVREVLDDGYIIACPWEHLHTTPGNVARIWKEPKHTFNCFHAHCDGRTWNDVRLVYEPTAYDWQHKQSRSVEQSIKHLPSYPEITMAEQEDQLAQAASFLKSTIQKHLEVDDGKALAVNYPAGTGKTHVSAEFIVEENIDTGWMAPTHAIAHSVKPLKAIRHIQTCNKHNCSEPNLHAICGEKGYNTIRSLHKQHNCYYMQQFYLEGSAVYMQQYFKSGYPASHSLVINDELTLQDWLPERKVTIQKLQKVAAWKDTDSEDDRFLRAIQGCITDMAQAKTPVSGKAIFDRLDQTGQLTNWLGVLIQKYANTLPKTNIDLSNDPFDEATHLYNKPDVLLPHLVKAFTEELVKWQSGKEWNSRIRIGREPSGEYALFITEPRHLIEDKEGKFPPFIHLDATIDETIHSKLFGRELKVLRASINPAPGTQHLAVRTNKFYGKTALTATHKNGDANKDLARTVKEARYMLKKVDPDGSIKIGLISHMDCVDAIAEALGIPQDQTGYYWNIRGSNSLESCDVLLLVGTPILNPQTVATMARSLYHDDPDPINEEWTRENGYADSRLKHLASFLTNSELTQAAHRIRPIRHANKTIISFCEGEIDFLPITETFTSLPYMTEEGENLHTTNKEAAYEKVRIAYAELLKNGEQPTTEEVRKLAKVKRNTVVEWMKENASQDVPNVNTQSIEEIGGTPRSMIVNYIDPRVLDFSDIPKEGDRVLTPLGIGTFLCIHGTRVGVSIDGCTTGMKCFDLEQIGEIPKQQPFDTGLDELFAGLGG